MQCPLTPQHGCSIGDDRGPSSGIQQEDLAEHKAERRTKFKNAMNALRVNYHLEILDWDFRKEAHSCFIIWRLILTLPGEIERP